MKIRQASAVALLKAVGYKTADKLDPDKLGEKLASFKKFGETVEELDISDEKMSELAGKVLQNIEAEGEFEVVPTPPAEEVAEEAPKKKKPAPAAEEEAPAKKPAAAAPAKKKPAPVEDEVDEEPAPKKKAAKAAAEEKPAKPAKPPKEKVPSMGVRDSLSRPFVAGAILKKHGLAEGITEEMIAEVDAEYGKANPRETKFTLRNAWHAIRAYQAKDPDAAIAKMRAKEAAEAAPAEAPAKKAPAKKVAVAEEEEAE